MKNSDIEEMQRIAESRGGKCLSDTYVSGSTKLLWECAKGHQWQSVPNNIKRGSWCLQCAGKSRKTINDMQKIAKQRGGRCLSDTYVNINTRLLWECSEGHQWKAMPHHVNRGSWCPYCSRLSKRK